MSVPGEDKNAGKSRQETPPPGKQDGLSLAAACQLLEQLDSRKPARVVST